MVAVLYAQDENMRGPMLGHKQANIKPTPGSGKLKVYACSETTTSATRTARKPFAFTQPEAPSTPVAKQSGFSSINSFQCSSSPATTLGLSTPPHKMKVFQDHGVLANAAAMVNARMRLLMDKENVAPPGSPQPVARQHRGRIHGGPKLDNTRQPLSVLCVKRDEAEDEDVDMEIDMDGEQDSNSSYSDRFVYLESQLAPEHAEDLEDTQPQQPHDAQRQQPKRLTREIHFQPTSTAAARQKKAQAMHASAPQFLKKKKMVLMR